MPPKPKKKAPQNVCSMFFENKSVEFTIIARNLRDPDSLPCKCNNSPFADRHHHHMMTGDLRIVNNVLRKLFINDLNIERLFL